MACTDWRGVEERIEWMLDHPPGSSGWCARETWQALGGDKNPPCPPAWGCSDANEVYDKIKQSGRYWTSTPIPRGAVIAWKYGSNGHAALSYGNGKICTTDPNGNPGGVGIESLSYPEKWGASASARIWTDQYNGVRFDIDEEGDEVSDVLDYDYLEKPSGTFTATRDYKTLDQSSWTPPRDGWENTLVYLNIKPTFRSGKTHGAIRIRLMRENGDAHGYDTISIDADDLDDEDGNILRQYFTWELGEKGAGTKIQLRCVGGLESALIGTRYTSKAVVAG